jgi:hypothetical protein
VKGALALGIKRKAEDNNAWSFTTTPLYAIDTETKLPPSGNQKVIIVMFKRASTVSRWSLI